MKATIVTSVCAILISMYAVTLIVFGMRSPRGAGEHYFETSMILSKMDRLTQKIDKMLESSDKHSFIMEPVAEQSRLFRIDPYAKPDALVDALKEENKALRAENRNLRELNAKIEAESNWLKKNYYGGGEAPATAFRDQSQAAGDENPDDEFGTVCHGVFEINRTLGSRLLDWKLIGLSDRVIIIKTAQDHIKSLRICDEFEGIRILNIDTRNGVVYTSAGKFSYDVGGRP